MLKMACTIIIILYIAWPWCSPAMHQVLREISCSSIIQSLIFISSGRERDDVQNVGRFACLAAYDTRARDALPTSSAPIDLGLLVGTIVQLLLPPSMRQNCGANHVAAGVLGAVVLDTMLEHVPPKKNAIVNGRVVPEATRARMAYLSNLAVSPRARRRKVGLALLRRAEAVAVEWGCRSMALHVDPENEAAVRLYEGAGYRFVARQPEWQRLLEGRSNALTLMLRVLPRKGSAGVDADAAL